MTNKIKISKNMKMKKIICCFFMCLHLFWPCFGVAPRLHICADRFHGISWARPKAIFEETLRKWIKKENFEFYMFFFRF
jgi:hypothetical protein